MRKICLISLCLFYGYTALAQDMLKLKETKKIFTGQMVWLNLSSFKFRLVDGGMIQSQTELIDSVYLSNPDMFAEAFKVTELRPRIVQGALKEPVLPVAVLKQMNDSRNKHIITGLKEAGSHYKIAGSCMVSILACISLAAIIPTVSKSDGSINKVLALGGIVLFTAGSIELIRAGKKLKRVKRRQYL